MRKAYRLGVYEKAMREEISLAEKLQTAEACGFDFLEISIDESERKLSRLTMGRTERFELRREVHGGGIPIGSMCLSAHRKFPLGSPDADVRRRSLEIMRLAIEFAEEFGIRTIQLAGYDVYYEPSSAETALRFGEGLETCCRLAAAAGVTLGFETMETPFMNTVAKAMRYVDRLNSPYLQVYPDVGNLSNSGEDPVLDLLGGRGHIVAAHLKETIPGVFRNLTFGSGQVDFPAAVHALRLAGCRRFVGEMWDAGLEQWRAEVGRANRFLRDILDKEFEDESVIGD